MVIFNFGLTDSEIGLLRMCMDCVSIHWGDPLLYENYLNLRTKLFSGLVE